MENKRFEDIGGYELQKAEAKKIVKFFSNYELFKENGAYLPRGIVFYGQPGTGKTLFAKAIVNESNVNALSLSPDELVKEESISLSIKEIFSKAKENAPSIILIDEIDRIVCCGGIYKEESSKEKEVLRCFLTEIDNLKDSDCLVIATSNSHILDMPKSLIRNGRIEKHIEIPLPDTDQRADILKKYLSKNDRFKDISITDLAIYTPAFSAASLESLVNTVLIDCISENRNATFKDFLEPIETIKSRGMKQKGRKDNSVVIYHELGHFITDYVISGEIGMISINPYGQTGGSYTRFNKGESYNEFSLSEIKNTCVCLIGGLVATKIFLNEPYLGADSDLFTLGTTYMQMVQNGLTGAKDFALHFLYKDRGRVQLNSFTNELTDDFVKFLNECEMRATNIINNNRRIIEVLFNELVTKGVLTAEETKELIKDIPVVKE